MNYFTHVQAFPQVLRTWRGGGAGSSFDGGSLSQYMGGTWVGGGLKMLSRNTCDGAHLIVTLPAISLQACKFTKNELLHTYF